MRIPFVASGDFQQLGSAAFLDSIVMIRFEIAKNLNLARGPANPDFLSRRIHPPAKVESRVSAALIATRRLAFLHLLPVSAGHPHSGPQRSSVLTPSQQVEPYPVAGRCLIAKELRPAIVRRNQDVHLSVVIVVQRQASLPTLGVDGSPTSAAVSSWKLPLPSFRRI